MFKVDELLHLSSDAAFGVDHDLRVTTWNQHAEKLLGYTTSEALGSSCHEILHALFSDGEPLCVPNCQAKHCFGRCQPFSIQSCWVRRKNGTKVSVSLSSLVIPQTEHYDQSGGGTIAIIFLRTLPVPEAEVNPAPEAILRCFTLGHFSLGIADQRIAFERWERKQALILLKYLLSLRGQAVHRERLMEYLWPEATNAQGRERLKVTVYFLRQALRRAGIDKEIIVTSDQSYLLKREQIWVDADAYEAQVNQGRLLEQQGDSKAAILSYEQAQTLYRGHYLEEDRYDELCAEERERLREICLNTLGRMAKLYTAHEEFDRSIQVCRTALVQEPCLESFHCMAMQNLWQLGRRNEALVQFGNCKKVLAQNLSVEPSLETQKLYQKILSS